MMFTGVPQQTCKTYLTNEAQITMYEIRAIN